MSVITGSRIFEPLARKYGLPFVVAGFEGEEILAAIAALVKLQGQGRVLNMYPSAVNGRREYGGAGAGGPLFRALWTQPGGGSV